jgi:hypothetical protein
MEIISIQRFFFEFDGFTPFEPFLHDNDLFAFCLTNVLD